LQAQITSLQATIASLSEEISVDKKRLNQYEEDLRALNKASQGIARKFLGVAYF
jgi:peptidoglycan hydrolase CwlO-like protein